MNTVGGASEDRPDPTAREEALRIAEWLEEEAKKQLDEANSEIEGSADWSTTMGWVGAFEWAAKAIRCCRHRTPAEHGRLESGIVGSGS